MWAHERERLAWSPLDLLDRARRLPKPESVWTLFESELAAAGFGRSFYTFGIPASSVAHPLHQKEPCEVFCGGRGSFVMDSFSELARRPDLIATDPVPTHCRRQTSPYFWSRTTVKSGERSALAFLKDFGLGAFVAMPLKSGDGEHYGNFTVYCNEPHPKSWLQHARHFAPLLHVSAIYLQESLSATRPIYSSGVVLSPRQRECLLWASRGLHAQRIAERLGLSEAVVYEYLASARRKLGCATTVQAVARAVRSDLIAP